jgi:hypothetical protein
MLLRRVAPAALAIAAICACEPGVNYDAGRNPQQTNYAVFDPTAVPPQIPVPNDLALGQAGSIPGAQGELLQLFVSKGGFPNDQEVPISIDLVQIVVDPSGAQVRSQPNLDFSSFRICTGSNPNCNLAVMKSGSPPVFMTDIAAPTAADFVASGDHGTLNIRRKPRQVPLGQSTVSTRTWDPSFEYVAVLRGGPNGITVNGGQPIFPQPALFIIEQGKNLLDPANQGLIPGNSAAERQQNAQALTQLQNFYSQPNPVTHLPAPFAVAAAAFPKTDIASITTFAIAPVANTAPAAQVVIDSGSGTAPLPFNALLDGNTLPDNPLAPAPNAKVQNLPSTFGALASGIATLDGFSTTAMLLVPVSAPVIAALGQDPSPASQFAGNVFLYDLTDQTNPVLVAPSTYDDLLPDKPPFQVLRQQVPVPPAPGPGVWASVLIGLQPAAATKVDVATSPMVTTQIVNPSKPLKEATEYAFIITNRIKGTDGRGLGRPTVGSILLFNNPLWAGGKSQLAGIPDAQAKALERMRAQIANLLTKLGGGAPFTKSEIAAAYTFRTQTITSPALQLAAAPYAANTNPNVTFVGSINVLPPSVSPTPGAVTAFSKYGIETAFVASGNILEVIEATLPTPNLLSTATGAFDPNLLVPNATPPIDLIPALIAVPNPNNVPACPPPAPAGLKCAPLVVFHHGLNGGRAQMLLGADELAAKGFVVAAIDAPKHGDRALCTTDPSAGSGNPGAPPAQCAVGMCQAIPGSATGDPFAPGQCKQSGGTAGALKKNPVFCIFANCAAAATDGVSTASGNYVVSANLFRTRDTFRQDIIDVSNLVLAMARLPPPLLPAPAGTNPVTAELQSKGIVIDPSKVFWEGQSLGGILGTINVAVNPRISEAVLNVPGGTFVDIASTSPPFVAQLNPILASQNPPILPNTGAYLQFLQVAKWVLDPAEPINFAGHLIGGTDHPTLPNLLLGGAQTPKSVLGQMAVCDNTVPNPFNLLLFNTAGLVQSTANKFQIFKTTTAPQAPNGFCFPTGASSSLYPAPFDTGAVTHGFLLDHGAPSMFAGNQVTLSSLARTDAATFLANPATLPPDTEAQ